MTVKPFVLLPLAALCAACTTDLSFTSGGDDTTWVVSQINGENYPARATLTFENEGEIVGLAPCNQYRATQTARAPRFDPGPITVTRASCSQGSLEVQYLFVLSQMTRSQISGDTLTLSEPGGRSITFKADG